MRKSKSIRKSKSVRVNHRKTKKGGARRNIYVVIEQTNDDFCHIHPRLYNTYDEAYQAAIEKYKEQLDEERAECAEYDISMASKVDVDENPEGVTKLYIEKEIYLTIYRFNVPKPNRTNRTRSLSRSRSRSSPNVGNPPAA